MQVEALLDWYKLHLNPPTAWVRKTAKVQPVAKEPVVAAPASVEKLPTLDELAAIEAMINAK